MIKSHYSFCGFLSHFHCILATYSLHRKNKFTTTTRWQSLVVVEVEDLVAYKVPRQWVLFKVSSLPMMSDYEEDLDDFPTFSAENSSIKAESVVGANRAESMDQIIAGSGIARKIPPLLAGSTSWFKNEELIDDRLDLTVLAAEKTRTSTEGLTCRRCRNTQRIPEVLRAEDGVKYF